MFFFLMICLGPMIFFMIILWLFYDFSIFLGNFDEKYGQP